ncbi:hypothetical protein QRT08_14880 [Halalkalicoccus sp. NIPERK01]|nr:hypothetical protein [Halalkalicoccus sp. NIPERK01]MDL5363248.1 hypothetical protein [Halalkalicoccus sp. NIPERK01]
MKQGAGENPFAEDPDPDAESAPSSTDKPHDDISYPNAPEEEKADDPQQVESQPMQIPYKFRRSSVQDGRDRVPLFLHAETKSDERDALRTLENQFGDNVSLTDLREALVIVGLDHLDEVETQLQQWGYGITFDE